MNRTVRQVTACIALLLLLPSAQAELLYKSSRVELYRVPAESGARNEHPVRLEAYPLEDRFAEITLSVAERGGDLPLVDEKTRLDLGEQLARALRRVGPEDDIHLVVYRVERSGVLNTTRWASSARVFVEGGRVNAIFGDLEQFQNEYRDPGKPLPPMGSRTAPTSLPGKLTASGTARLAEGRGDWVQIPVVALDNRGVAPGAVSSAPAPAPAARPAVSWQEVEEGLATLDRMRQRGLVSQEEFDRMKGRLLESAMPAAR